ncbi:arsenosugar biosynthesis radical SAM (seleno)protein ArsS [Fontimonas sp. SYSU GA230001]|uniref:arsenosugar biosynthesis radical SAM (seleno)protein ArsS n=1 Tax=Fontimonas sp. SYSU GA230001 TaxID=3142450 RepID=UPI0032B42D8B
MSAAFPLVVETHDPVPARHSFTRTLCERRVNLTPLSIDTLQVNLTKLCNQACRHCHVDASPARTEALSREGIERIAAILAAHPQIQTLDLTGGAPELHPDFDWLVERAAALHRRVMVRHNLTVTFDGHPQSGASKAYLPEFFARHRVEVVSSLPYYQELFTDKQRGSGVFGKSIDGLKQLNALGYGAENSGLVLDLVFNPVGPYLPAPQASLEADYKRVLLAQYGVVFNRLFTITNMPINRFALHLRKAGQYDSYMDKLVGAFNPSAAENAMCRSLISVGPDGTLYDCDFNQQLGMPVQRDAKPLTIFDFDAKELLARRIRVANHCFGCTAGAGSSCGGATT